MNKYPECVREDSGQCIPYTDFNTTSSIRWVTSSSNPNPMSAIDFGHVPVEYAEVVILMDLNVDKGQSLSGQNETLVDWIIDKQVGYGIRESDAVLTMIASEEVLQRDWDTPEEDQAWADL